jgi:protein-S-isoprenylcysteine O-methyltransferase Ste14
MAILRPPVTRLGICGIFGMLGKGVNRELSPVTTAEKDNPGVIAPPPLLFAGFLVAGLLLEWVWPAPFLAGNWQYIIGAVLILAAIALMASGVSRFRRAGTNVPTYRPTTALVTEGPYRYSRNPLYISLFLLYAGIGVMVDGAWILLLILPLFLLMRYGVVAREERYLERKFGTTYLDYKSRVRRWL